MSYDRLGRRAAPPPAEDDVDGMAPVASRSATPNAARLARGRAAAASFRAAQAAAAAPAAADAGGSKAAKAQRRKRPAALRILPLTAFVAALVLSFRVADLWDRRETLVETVTVGTVAIADAGDGGAPGAELPAGPRVAELRAATTTDASGGTPRSAVPLAQLAQAGSDDKVDPFNLGKSQIELLQSLADRRRELEERERTLVQREGLLAAAEHRIERKIEELNGIKGEIEGLIRKYDKQEEEQLSSLVKIYETMKPKDAAKIFDALDMDILLQVIERMKASKTAPVLAAMTPERAKEVTARIAERRSMPDIN